MGKAADDERERCNHRQRLSRANRLSEMVMGRPGDIEARQHEFPGTTPGQK
jgi:hypothetical protein